MNIGLISHTGLNSTVHKYSPDNPHSPPMRAAKRRAEEHDLQAALQNLNVVINTVVLYTATHTVNDASRLYFLHCQSLTLTHT